MEPSALAADPAAADAIHDLDVMMIRLSALTREARDVIEGLDLHGVEVTHTPQGYNASNPAGIPAALGRA